MSMFDLLEVEWNNEHLGARPISWNKDESDIDNLEDEDIIPTAFELSCPSCGSRCVFSHDDPMIECDNCGSNATNPKVFIVDNNAVESSEPVESIDDFVEKSIDDNFESLDDIDVSEDESDDEELDEESDDEESDDEYEELKEEADEDEPEETKEDPVDVLDNLTKLISDDEIDL